MAIFNSYVKLPDGNWWILRNIFGGTVSKSCPGFSLDLGLTKEPGISWLHFWVEHFELHWEKTRLRNWQWFLPIFFEPGNGKSHKHRLLITFFKFSVPFHNHASYISHRHIHFCTISIKNPIQFAGFSHGQGEFSRGCPASFQITRARLFGRLGDIQSPGPHLGGSSWTLGK